MIEHILNLRIAGIVQETATAASFLLEDTTGNDIVYKPGQFLTLIFNHGLHEVRRSYSISSPPGSGKQVRITVKRVHNGEISRLLLDHYHTGDILKAALPAGMFVLDDNKADKARDIFFLAAGSGISPVFSLLTSILNNTRNTSVILAYQNHSEKETIFRPELEEIAGKFTHRFKWYDFVSYPEAGGHSSMRLNNEILEALIPAVTRYLPADTVFFVCGPPSFMRMCQFTILLMGYRAAQVKKEYFVINTPPPPPLIVNPVERMVEVEGTGEDIHFTTVYPKTILESALEKGVALPYSCRGGRCSTCVAKCIRGEVVMSMNDVLTEADIRNGLVLTCVGYAVTDIALTYRQG
jgi:ring-1,2-phenylacetyl-CoA epoxidase subunit PaaE